MLSFFRFLSRNKFYTFVEAFGLAVSLGFIILLAAYSYTEYNIGAKQPYSKEIYAVGMGSQLGMTLEALPTFGPSIPEIASYTRYGELLNSIYFGYGGETYKAKGIGVDPNFFDFFDYALKGCAKNQAIQAKNDVLLSESFARELFGDEDPIGKTIKVPSGDLPDLVVTGIIEDFGPFDIFDKVDFLYNIANSKAPAMDSFGVINSFITLAEGVSPEMVENKLLDAYMQYWNYYHTDNSSGSVIWGSTLTRLDKLYFSDFDRVSDLRSGNRRQVNILLIVGLVLLVSAVFNYINLTVAQTGKRAKEMATRRLLGSSRFQVVLRYLRESFLFTLGCFLGGCFLAFVFRPVFDRMLQTQIALTPDIPSILVAVSLLLIIAFLSGIIPALIVAKYKSIDVVKQQFGFSGKMRLRQVFIGLQSLISVVLIAVAFAMTLQIHHLATLPLGYRTANLIQITTGGMDVNDQHLLRDRLKALPQVKEVGLCGQLPSTCGFNGVKMDEETVYFLAMPTLDSTAFHLFGFQVFDPFSDPADEKVWLTKDAQALLHVTKDNPKVGLNRGYEICGIIDNFHIRDAIFEPTMPNVTNSVRMITDDYPYQNYQVVEIMGDKNEALAAVKEACITFTKEVMGYPKSLDEKYIEDYLYEQIKGKRDTMLLVIAFMIVSVLISTLGLIAMSVYHTQQQSRQTAVRKVYGSTTQEEIQRLSGAFMVIAAVAVAIAIPIAIYLIKMYLTGFVNRIDFPIVALCGAAIFALVISYLSVSSCSRQAATRNPVDTFKTVS